jgi:hypothetical protein
MGMRRFARLTNAFSKKVENLSAAVALHFICYNCARPQTALKNPTQVPCDGGWRHGSRLKDRGDRCLTRSLTGQSCLRSSLSASSIGRGRPRSG